MHRTVTMDVPCFLIGVLLLSVNIFSSISVHRSCFVSRWWLFWNGVSYSFSYNCWISDKECNAYGSVWVLTVVHDAERLDVYVCVYYALAVDWTRSRQVPNVRAVTAQLDSASAISLYTNVMTTTLLGSLRRVNPSPSTNSI